MSLFGKNKVRVRFPPSPTGFMHLGGLRTALYNYLFAKHHGGEFILRIEDTDQARFVPGAMQNIIDTLNWAGLPFDEGPMLSGDAVGDKGPHGPYVQSKRLDLYKKHAADLVATGNAYPCFCTAERLEQMRKEQTLMKQPPMYDGMCRALSTQEVAAKRAQGLKEVIRMKMPKEGVSKFDDQVRGEIEFQNALIDDQVLMKSDGYPTYHLAVVVDDHAMNITHVIRGEEWLPSTPKHLMLYKFFGWKAPLYAHLPLFLAQGGGKLSKRDMSTSAFEYQRLGYLKEAIINFIALLGWHPVGENEILSLDELVKEFDLSRVNKAGAIFSTEKLDWLNGMYLRRLNAAEFTALCRPYLVKAGLIGDDFPGERLEKMVVLEQERIKKLTEVADAIGFMFKPPQPEKQILVWKTQTPEIAAQRLTELAGFLETLGEHDWKESALETKVKEMIAAAATPVGETLWPMRVALSGRAASPGPFAIAAALGKEETLQRIKNAISTLVVS